jgi:hypothetical protein
MFKWIGIILVFLLTAGCDSQVGDFVKGVRGRSPAATTVSSNGPTALKVSPGRIESSTASISLKGQVSLTNRILTSPNASARVTISRNRASFP